MLGLLPLLRGLPWLLPPAWHQLLLLLHQRQPLLQAGETLQSVQVCDWLGLLWPPAACTGRLLPPCSVTKAKLHVFSVCPTSSRAPEAACWVQSAPSSPGWCLLPALPLPAPIIVVCLPLAPAGRRRGAAWEERLIVSCAGSIACPAARPAPCTHPPVPG